MAQGWVSIHREIWNSWVWKDKPFSKGQAWIDLILMANHEDKKVLVGNSLVLVKRGSRIMSQLKLAERWGWGAGRTRKFLRLLESDNMIAVNATKRYTLITIINYEKYQNQNGLSLTASMDKEKLRNTNGMKAECKRNESGIQTECQSTTNNNENKENKDIYSADADFLWGLYPEKKGKKDAMNKIPKLIKEYGKYQIERCIKRYLADVDRKRKSGFSDLRYKNGSTFFNSGYMDYLDENVPEEKPEPVKKPSGRHTVSLLELVKAKEERERHGQSSGS